MQKRRLFSEEFHLSCEFRLYLDEDVDPELGEMLRRAGFDVLTTGQAGRANQRIPDEDQLIFASEQGRAIISHNVRDFERLAVKWSGLGRNHAGIIVSGRKSLSELEQGIQRLQEMYPEGIANYCLRPPVFD